MEQMVLNNTPECQVSPLLYILRFCFLSVRMTYDVTGRDFGIEVL